MLDIKDRQQLAIEAAREAGKITLEYFQTDDLVVERKADNSPVTVADRRAEQHLRQRIAEEFPNDGIVGEEFPTTEGNSGYRWIVDPIDGTKSFISGVPLYGTLLGVEHEGRGVIGVIYMPALDEMVYAATGQGAWHELGSKPRRPACVSSVAKLSDGLFCTCEVKTFLTADRQAAYDRLQATAQISRTWGDCYGYLLVATGRAAVMVDPVANVWDIAAVQPIIEESGGRFTDWQGQATIHSGDGIGTNGHVHEEVLALVAG
ncbi:MAG: histidinol-phosphatase [Planctomycetes bacterium]|nr:histidinol-phosphatase [Planctomycetota bacterium]